MKDESIRATSVYSDDGGKTWNLGEYAPATSVDGEELRYDENTIAELSDGSLLMSSRSNNGKLLLLPQPMVVRPGRTRTTSQHSMQRAILALAGIQGITTRN